MPDYRVYLTRQPAQDITSDTDAEALIQARALVENHEFEVWQGERMVARVGRQRRTGGSVAQLIENKATRGSPMFVQGRSMSNFNRAVEALRTLTIEARIEALAESVATDRTPLIVQKEASACVPSMRDESGADYDC